MRAIAGEPYKLPAGVLALLVHSLFFALLYFGFNWNKTISSPAAMKVELWSSLPEPVIVPPVKVAEAPPPVPQKMAEPEMPQPPVAEPEIIMPKKIVIPKPAKLERKKPAVPKPVEKIKPVPETPTAPDPEASRIAQEQAARDRAAQEQAAREQIAREQADQAAAKGRVVDEYKAKIITKIRRNIVDPPDRPDDAYAEFFVTLLPGGAVLKAELKKSSGNAAWENAVERAILKSDPLPLPPDGELFSRFRELNLTFKPGKTKNN